MTAFATAALRVIGLIWAVGAVSIIRNARKADDEDARRWIITGGILTFVAGLLLLAGSRWGVVPAVLLVIQQGAFHYRQSRRLPAGAPRPSPVHVVIAAMVAALAAILAFKGALI